MFFVKEMEEVSLVADKHVSLFVKITFSVKLKNNYQLGSLNNENFYVTLEPVNI